MKLTNKSTIITVLVVVVLLGGFLAVRYGSNVGAEALRNVRDTGETRTSFSEKAAALDLGSVSMARGKAVHRFLVLNDVGRDIVVRRAMTSCMCTTAYLAVRGESPMGPFGMPGHGVVPVIDKRVESGEELLVSVVFDPAAHGPSGIGAVSREVSLERADGSRMTLEFRVNVTP
ncbi:DUF1573 domain-containing protein [Candidatus Parcubacteria bacterium]|nr:MAG: DUF1573 domain-containing protein [Candidatus Parcubacteria bacterium]